MTNSNNSNVGLQATAISFAANVILGAIKLVFGIVGSSSALVADAVESLGDVAGTLIVRAGIVIAAKPADANHPYGHGKAEPLAALAVSLLMVAAAAAIIIQSVGEIRAPQHAPEHYTLIVILIVIAIKEGMYRYERRAGDKTQSTALLADAWHHRMDAFTSIAAAIGIAVSIMGGRGYEAADDWAAIAACLVILLNAILLAKLAVHELMDAVPVQAMPDDISSIALTVEGAKAIETVLIRKSGPYYRVTLHVEVDPLLSVREGHRIAHEVKDFILAKRASVADVLVHIEPHEEK